MTRKELAAIRALYAVACHHPKCKRSEEPFMCTCGVSKALQEVREILSPTTIKRSKQSVGGDN